MLFVQLCPTLCDPVDSCVQGMLQARILEWVPFPPPGDLPNPGIKHESPALAGRVFTSEMPGKLPCESRQKQKMGYGENTTKISPSWIVSWRKTLVTKISKGRDFPGDLGVETPPSHAGSTDSVRDPGAKIPHAS